VEEGKRRALVTVLNLLNFGLLIWLIWSAVVLVGNIIVVGIGAYLVTGSLKWGLIVGTVTGVICVVLLVVVWKALDWLWNRFIKAR
jgi:hypothetical protein